MKNIFNEEFWEKRIRNAESASVPHYSVYLTHQAVWNKILDEHLKIIKEYVSGSVLDAGCAYGRLAHHLHDGITKYTGVDQSKEFVLWAKKDHPEHSFYRSDLRDLKAFDNTQFDWAICISIKRMVIDNAGEEEWKKMEKELKRVATKVLILEYEEPEKYEVL